MATNSHIVTFICIFLRFHQRLIEKVVFTSSPLLFTPLGSRPWFFNNPHPVQKLKSLLTDTCVLMLELITNHSLRATGATVLFDARVPEAVIQKRTRHKSLDALCSYERVTLDQ